MFSHSRVYSLYLVLLSFLFVFIHSAQAISSYKEMFPHPFYIGGLLGYGTTTWGSLIEQPQPRLGINQPATWATPLDVQEGGFTWGFVAGYEIIPMIAIEGRFVQLPVARIHFSDNSYITCCATIPFKSVTSITRAYSVSIKVMAPLFDIPLRLYASAGPAIVTRGDFLAQTDSRVGVTFGAGLNYIWHQNWLLEAGFQYYTGWGRAEDQPVYDFIPFIYTIHGIIAYRLL